MKVSRRDGATEEVVCHARSSVLEIKILSKLWTEPECVCLYQGHRRLFNSMTIEELGSEDLQEMSPKKRKAEVIDPRPMRPNHPRRCGGEGTSEVIEMHFVNGCPVRTTQMDVSETNSAGVAARILVRNGVSLEFPREYARTLLPFLQSLGLELASEDVVQDAGDTVSITPAELAQCGPSVHDLAVHCRWVMIFAASFDAWYGTVRRVRRLPSQRPLVGPASFVDLSEAEIDGLIEAGSNEGALLHKGTTFKTLAQRIADAVRRDLPGCPFLFPRVSACSPKDLVDVEGSRALRIPADRPDLVIRSLVDSDRVRSWLKMFRSLPRSTHTLPRTYPDSLDPDSLDPDSERPRPPWRRMSIVLQPWRDFPPDSEWRCFVANGSLAAISQYDPYADIHADIHGASASSRTTSGEGQQIVHCVSDIVAALAPVWHELPFDSAVMDVRWDGTHATIVEFNAFGGDLTSGSALFGWVDDHHLLHGSRPLVSHDSEGPLPTMVPSGVAPVDAQHVVLRLLGSSSVTFSKDQLPAD